MILRKVLLKYRFYIAAYNSGHQSDTSQEKIERNGKLKLITVHINKCFWTTIVSIQVFDTESLLKGAFHLSRAHSQVSRLLFTRS